MEALAAPEACGGMAALPPVDILEVVDPSAQMKAEMRMATKLPSEWLRLLCRDWSLENEAIVAAVDIRFLQYKSYLRGQLTSQLLCRLSISGNEGVTHIPPAASDPPIDFWKILGVDDRFDHDHIVANIERFCSLYNIRGGTLDDPALVPSSPPLAISPNNTDGAAAMVGNNYMAASANNADGTAALAGGSNYFADTMVHDPATAAAAAAVAGFSANYTPLLYPVDTSPNSVTMATKPVSSSTSNTMKSQQRRIKAEMRLREKEAYSVRKAAEKASRAATREERRQRKLAMRRAREEFALKQKEAALRRAAELVQSNRVPIEITRGAAAAQAAANGALVNMAIPAAEAMVAVPATNMTLPVKKGRSSIVISTASDLDQIVTHSNNLWAKYNAIAKEHNQKVNWIVVAKELGIHVKVREKYARMHARAKARGFDFVNWGNYRIKDFPQYFLDPLGPGQHPQPDLHAHPMKTGEPSKMEAFSTPQQPAEALPSLPEGFAAAAAAALPSLSESVVAAAMQPAPMNEMASLPAEAQVNEMVGLAAEAVGVVGAATSYSSNRAVIAAAAAVQQQPQPLEFAEMGGSLAANAPVNEMVGLAAEAAGVVGAATSLYPSNRAVIAAAAAVQQQQPLEVADDDMTHVIPALPPANNVPMDDPVKNVYFPNLGSAAV